MLCTFTKRVRRALTRPDMHPALPIPFAAVIAPLMTVVFFCVQAPVPYDERYKNNNALAANNHEGVVLRASGGSRTRTGVEPAGF